MTDVTPDLRGTTAIDSGATGGMGNVLCTRLLASGAHVIAIGRNRNRIAALRARVGPEAQSRLNVITADLSSRDDVLKTAHAIVSTREQIDLLINNAGAHVPEHRTSVDGIEMHIAIDYLAAYGLTTLLASAFRPGSARVINIASDTINDVRPVTIFGKPRPATLDLESVHSLAELNPADGYVSFEAYARAKLMTVTAGYTTAERLAPAGITVNSLHPGIVATDIIDDLIPAPLRPFRGIIRSTMLTPAQGADTAFLLATQPQYANITGQYFRRTTPATTPAVSHDLNTRHKLHELTDKYFDQ
jgi:NAD(P)-dependent dehydrogenase (short-subunit alcohol dehydrogenase family)